MGVEVHPPCTMAVQAVEMHRHAVRSQLRQRVVGVDTPPSRGVARYGEVWPLAQSVVDETGQGGPRTYLDEDALARVVHHLHGLAEAHPLVHWPAATRAPAWSDGYRAGSR